MPAYRIAGLVLRTPFEIVELPEVAGDDADWTVVQGPAPSAEGLTQMFEVRTADDRLWMTLRGAEGRFTLTFENQVAFDIDVRARVVTFAPHADTADTSLRHLLIDQVVPHLLAADGELVVHASAVAIDGGAVAFIGPSGSGKSSLAAACVQHGATLLADDFVLLREHDGGYVATVAYPSLRLWADSAEFFAGSADALPTVNGYSDKRRWASEAPADTTLPLRAVVILGDPPPERGPACLATQVRGADAFAVLYRQGFRIARSDRERQRADLLRFTELARTVPMIYLEHRRDYAAIGEVLAEVQRALAE
ncbi:MAG TPA: hypothetical protein VFZ89_09400, partial [Solirubrobacteraceae bacterium]